jgi:hypothetical protein
MMAGPDLRLCPAQSLGDLLYTQTSEPMERECFVIALRDAHAQFGQCLMYPLCELYAFSRRHRVGLPASQLIHSLATEALHRTGSAVPILVHQPVLRHS